MNPKHAFAGFRLPLMPRWLVALDDEANLSTYRLHLRWNGNYRLRPNTPPQGAQCIAVIGHSHPYRRKLQRLPDKEGARNAMLLAAPDEFPLPAEEVCYALGVHGNEGHLFALPRSVLDTLAQRGLQPVIALIAGQNTDPEGCLATLEAYLKQGRSADLLRGKFMLSRRRLLQAQLCLSLLLTFAAAAWLALHPDIFLPQVESHVETLRSKGSSLPRLHRASEKMAHAQRQVAQFYATPEARFPELLARLITTLPPGHSLRSIELQNGTLKISGTGAHARDWLLAQGFSAADIGEEPLGERTLFHAERPL